MMAVSFLVSASMNLIFPYFCSQTEEQSEGFTRWGRARRSLIVVVLYVERIGKGNESIHIDISLTNGCWGARGRLIMVVLEIKRISKGHTPISIAVATDVKIE
jgi:hypothetical protein